MAVNERDEIGSDLVPDYMTSVKDGGFYGWPYSYFGQNVDVRAKPPRPDLVEKAIKPDYALGPHTASLGLTFNTGSLFGTEYQNGAFIGQHGSWNRKPRSGYKVIFVPFEKGKPNGAPKDILTGFISDTDKALGRPVGVAIDKSGALLVADDVGNIVWRVVPEFETVTTQPQLSLRIDHRLGSLIFRRCEWHREDLASYTLSQPRRECQRHTVAECVDRRSNELLACLIVSVNGNGGWPWLAEQTSVPFETEAQCNGALGVGWCVPARLDCTPDIVHRF